ncbi:MAG: MarR family transcriptional regulator [Thermoproteota archaeon]|nr:MarR family transcriptional regulator [Thermoleophilaceae bacterium]MDQ3084875.1 MarR family transcriptional regulator [Thermoproteota archaeon]
MQKAEIIQAINDKFTQVSTETILFHQIVADAIGLHITDHQCLHFIHRYGAMPAGRLAQLTGLTTGGVTGIIDRLEKAGYVRRVNDPKDRRRTIVESTQNKELERKIGSIFTPLHEDMHKLLSSYTDSELALLLDILTKSVNLIHKNQQLANLDKN